MFSLDFLIPDRYLDVIMLAGLVLPLVMFLIVKQTIRQGRTRA